MNKFEVGKLYTWIPIEPEEPEYMKESYVVWKPNRKDIWNNDLSIVTEELKQKAVITILEYYKTKNYSDLKILSTCGICGWIRVGKEFYDDWQPVTV